VRSTNNENGVKSRKKSGQSETQGSRCLHYGVVDGGVLSMLQTLGSLLQQASSWLVACKVFFLSGGNRNLYPF